MKDLLDEATRALREEGASDDAAHRFTRARVMASLHQGTVKRRTRLAFLLPIAATFVATSAWGVSSGRARVWVDEVKIALGFSKGEDTAPAPAPNAATKKRAPRAPEPVVEKTPAPIPEETAPIAEEAPPAPKAERAPALFDAGLDAELEAYRAAHRAHFTEQDSGAALALWDAYLAKSPGGRFALEARYNRALCLVRLGRKVEARTALEPFARGVSGGYRKREATELLQALDH